MKPLYEDNHLYIVEKKAGELTQGEEGLQGRAKSWLKTSLNKPGNVFLEPIHRLDKPVSGIVIFARTSKALTRLQEALRNQEIKKTYLAYVEGIPLEEGRLSHFLVHDSYHARIVKSSHPKAKEALLDFEILKREEEITLVKIKLQTGRYHQIRVQFSAIGHPIKGDKKYQSKLFFTKEGIALHHSKIDFPHPTSGEILSLTCDPLWLPKA